MGWAIIHRLTTVYITISNIMGYWLLMAMARSWKVRIATKWAKYTAMICPTTITPTDRYHRIRALMIPMLMR